MPDPGPITLAILTNARAADQRSMIGYGEMLLEAARQTEHDVVEVRPASLLGRLLPERIQGLPRKLANNLDRFVVTPLKLAGKRADIVHVVDPGNAVYLPLIRHRRSIVTVHDMIPYLARDGKLPGWRPTRTGRCLNTNDNPRRVVNRASANHRHSHQRPRRRPPRRASASSTTPSSSRWSPPLPRPAPSCARACVFRLRRR